MFYLTGSAIYSWKARQEAESDPEDFKRNEHFPPNERMDVLGTVAASFLNRPSSVTVCLRWPGPLPSESSMDLNPKLRLGRTIHLKFPWCSHLQAYMPSVGKSKRRA